MPSRSGTSQTTKLFPSLSEVSFPHTPPWPNEFSLHNCHKIVSFTQVIVVFREPPGVPLNFWPSQLQLSNPP